MQVIVREIKLKAKFDEEEMIKYVYQKYKVGKVYNLKLIKRSIDSRKKPIIFYVHSIVFTVDKLTPELLKETKMEQNFEYTDEYTLPKVKNPSKVCIVGFGPSGMFSALLLARSGYNPIIIEQGKAVDQRKEDIDNFFKNNILNSHSNVVFGEGGAGTFSDGKLTTNLKDQKIRFILKEFVKFGANKDVYYDGYPHIGTDILQEVVKNIRNEIISLGGKFLFSHKLVDFDYSNGYTLFLSNNNEEVILKCDKLILGIGHSSDETYEMLYKKGVELEPKSFSMGVRIEHPQSLINQIQFANDNIKEAANYKVNVKSHNRDVYSFCMCPGGVVVASNNSEGTIVTNGMSYYARDLENANSALLVNVNVDDYYNGNPLDGLYYRRKYERLCYEYSNSYKAPINLVGEFINGRVAKTLRSVNPTYPNGYVFADLSKVLPDFVFKSLKDSIKLIDRRLNGFNFKDAVVTAIESRSSSAVRIRRDQNYQANIKDLYPMGEGAGYAGGITSSALDGIKVATFIVESEF